MNELITKVEKLAELLKEYKNSLDYENCTYHVVENPGRKDNYFLIEISSKQIIRDGSAISLQRYIITRNINPNKVFKIVDIYLN